MRALLETVFEITASLFRADAETVERMRKTRYQRVFNSEDGQWVLADLCRQHNVLNEIPPTVNDGKIDSLQLAHLEGRRSVVVNLLKYVNQPLIEEPEQD